MSGERRLLTTMTFDTTLPALHDGESTVFQRHYQHGVHGMGTTLVYDWYADHSEGVFGFEIMLAKIRTGWDGFYRLQRYFLHDIPHIFSCSNSKISNTNTAIVTHFPLNMHIYAGKQYLPHGAYRLTLAIPSRLFRKNNTAPPLLTITKGQARPSWQI
jgi:hypothetical protein